MKQTMEQLEAELKAERSRLRALTTDQTRAQREKEAVLMNLRRTESVSVGHTHTAGSSDMVSNQDMSDVRQQLQQMKQENHDLERELRSNASAEQKARLLEAKVATNLENIEQLRQERSILAADHKELQRRYSKATEVRLCKDSCLFIVTKYLLRMSTVSRANSLLPRHLTTIAALNWISMLSRSTSFDAPSLTKHRSSNASKPRRLV